MEAFNLDIFFYSPPVTFLPTAASGYGNTQHKVPPISPDLCHETYFHRGPVNDIWV
jgi:hypothetical protein